MKGISINELGGLALAFAVVAITLGLGATILTQVQAQQTSNSIAYNASGYGLTGTNTMASWLPVIAVIIAAAIVIGIIVTAFR